VFDIFLCRFLHYYIVCLYSETTILQFEEAILELESERQTRLAAETEKADLERQRDWVLRQLEEACRDKTNIAKRLDEASAERNNALHQKSKALREKEKIAKRLAEVLRSNEVAVKQKDTILKEAMSEIEFERQARKTVEAAKTDLETAFNHVMVSLNMELKNIHELKRQRDEALYLKEKACREKSIITEQLDEALRLEENAVGQRDKSLWQQKGPSYVTVMSSGLVFALYFERCGTKEGWFSLD
jgi:chromosome segregation ATPase